jgi:hypothetical protein
MNGQPIEHAQSSKFLGYKLAYWTGDTDLNISGFNFAWDH